MISKKHPVICHKSCAILPGRPRSPPTQNIPTRSRLTPMEREHFSFPVGADRGLPSRMLIAILFLLFPLISFATNGPVVIVNNLTNHVIEYYYSYKAGFWGARHCERVAIPPRKEITRDFSGLTRFVYDGRCEEAGKNQINFRGEMTPLENCFIDFFNVPYGFSTTITVSQEDDGLVRCRYLPHGFDLS